MCDPKGSGNGEAKVRSVGDGGASWRLRALKRMKERSQIEGKSLEEISEERGMNLDQVMRDAERVRKKPKDRFHHRSYLDDVYNEGSRMKKPQTERSSFTRNRDRRADKRKEARAQVEGEAKGMNKFPSDGSFFQMFAQMSHPGDFFWLSFPPLLKFFYSEGTDESKSTEQISKKDTESSCSAVDNASIAEKLRQQLQSGQPLDWDSQKIHKPVTVHAHPASESLAKDQRFKKRRSPDKLDDAAALYKRSKRGEDAIDIDKTLARNISRHRRFDARDDLNADMEYDYGVGSDLFEKKRRKNRKETLSDVQKREKRKQVNQFQKMQTVQEKCPYCFDSDQIPKHLVMSIATAAYLRLPEKGALDSKHCVIVPLEHIPSTREADENAWTEIRNFKKALIQMNHEQARQEFVRALIFVFSVGKGRDISGNCNASHRS